jgi:hypothetical protein
MREAAVRDRVVGELSCVLDRVRALPDGGVSGRLVGGREVRIERVRGAAVEWIVLRTPICNANEMDVELVLERNARLALATIVLAGGVYWLRIALPVDSAELANPRRAVALVVDGAESLAPHIVTISSDVFSHYAL